MAQDSSGIFFACDDPKTLVVVPDTALVTRYRAMTAGSNQPLYVQLRGVKGHEGSIYGGQRYFVVEQVLEMRARQTGECPHVAQPVTRMLSR